MHRKEKRFMYWLAVLIFGIAVLAGTNVFGAAGNVDGLWDVDLRDAVLALQVCAGSSVTGVVLDADVNGDNKIGLAEAIYVLNYLSDVPRYPGDLGIPDDYEETVVSFRESFPDSAGSFDNFVGQLPESFDWREFGVVTRAKRGGNPITPIDDQGACGSCWAFGAVAAFESKILMAGGPEYDLSEQQQISCNTSVGQYGCCGGDISAVRFWTDRGPVEESCTDYGDFNTDYDNSCGCSPDFPHYCSKVSCSSFSSCPELSYRIKNYKTTVKNEETGAEIDTEEVKVSVSQYGPGVFRYDLYEDFYDFWKHGSYGEVYVHTDDSEIGGHVVSIIGWDDRKGAWLCKNSWGVEGPNGDGTFWMAYSGHRNGLRFAMSNFSITGGAACEYAIYPQGQSFSSSGGTGSINVTVNNGCTWTATSNVSWIAFTSGTSGSGNGKVYYSVSSNTGTVSRTGTVTAGGKEFRVTQSGLSCSYSIGPVSKAFEPSGGTGSVSVTATNGCNWTSKSNVSWISVVSGSSGVGSRTVNYYVVQNTSTSSRTGTLTVAGETFTVTQSGIVCSYSISPTSNSFTSSGGTGSVTVNAGTGCAWTAVSNNTSWITVTSGSSGTGNGTVGYSVASNSTCSSRSGTLTVANKTFTVTQDAASCTYNINPVSSTAGSSGGTGSINVTAPSCCSWSAISNASWITVTSGSSGSGNGTVSYLAAANTSGSSRTGTITVAGKIFTVVQDILPCTYNISPSRQSFTESGGTGSITVTNSSGCSWNAVSNASWITVTSGSTGSGNGTVIYSVASNSDTTPRTGTLTVAEQTFFILQSGKPELFISAYPYRIVEGKKAQVSVWFSGPAAEVDRYIWLDGIWQGITYPVRVTVTAGQLKADFQISADNNSESDGDRTAVLTAFTDNSDQIKTAEFQIIDDDLGSNNLSGLYYQIVEWGSIVAGSYTPVQLSIWNGTDTMLNSAEVVITAPENSGLDFYPETKTIYNLKSNAYSTCDIELRPSDSLPSGTYSLFISITSGSLSCFSDQRVEIVNQSSFDYTVSSSEHTITAEKGRIFDWSFTAVKNGDGFTQEVPNIKIYRESDDGITDMIYETYIDPRMPGSGNNRIYYSVVAPAEAGTYRIYAVINPDNTIQESNYSNNTSNVLTVVVND
ncbi:MAG: C1 family peptidase [Desulfococcaceae bacterium]